jgi:hypothetical protein
MMFSNNDSNLILITGYFSVFKNRKASAICNVAYHKKKALNLRKTKDSIYGNMDNVKSEGYTCMYVQACRQSMQVLNS